MSGAPSDAPGDGAWPRGSSPHAPRQIFIIVVRPSAVAAKPAKVRATLHRVGRRWQPLVPSGRLPTSRRTCRQGRSDQSHASRPRHPPDPPRNPPPSGRHERLHLLVRWRGGPVKRSGAMIRQRPGPMAKTDAGAISVPTLDPARCPSPLVSCHQPCPPATSAEGGGRTDDPTARDDTCRPVSACRHGVNYCRQHPAAPPSLTRASPPPAVR